MKRKWHHPERTAQKPGERTYWRSVDELEGSEDFKQALEQEFPRGAAELAEVEDEESRRGFLKLMGASASLAGVGLASCRRAEEHLIPFNEHVEWSVPGRFVYYSSAMPHADGCTPLIVTTSDGRPTKVDGNRLHPGCAGGSSHFVQASILDLYDPDRSKTYRRGGEESSSEEFQTEFLDKFDGAKTAILLGGSTSPTRARLLADVQAKFPGVKLFQHEVLAPVNRQLADEKAWGAGVSSLPRVENATRILSLDADFLGLDDQGEDAARNWAKGRNPDGEMSRLYVAEGAFTSTGGAADHRLRVAPSQIVKVAALFAQALGAELGDGSLSAAAESLVSRFRADVFDDKWIAAAARDLASAQGKSLVLVGSRQPVEVHLLGALMNSALGAVGRGKSPLQLLQTGHVNLPGAAELSESIGSGDIETVISLTPGNPGYDAPDLAEALKSVTLVHCGVRFDQTADLAEWHVPGAHYLESWADVRSRSGFYSVVQPSILPLYDGISEINFLLKLLGSEQTDLEAVRETFDGLAKGDSAKAWNLTLRDGFLNGVRHRPATASVGNVATELAGAELPGLPFAEAMEVVLHGSSAIYDGRYINNSWLQEVPDSITKLTWDNAAVISMATAAKLDVRDGDFLEVTVGERTLELPAIRVPGQADNCLYVAIGYGQGEGKAASNVEDNERVTGFVGRDCGWNAFQLGSGYVLSGASVKATGETYDDLAMTAHHWSMDGRAIIREGTQERYQETPDFAKKEGMDSHIPENKTLYKGPEYRVGNDGQPEAPLQGRGHIDENHQWAMVVDLNTCISCNSCTIACQSENNIPVVGREQVRLGREMHWIRMDRYFSSPVMEKDPNPNPNHLGGKRGRPVVDDDRVEMLTQPVACVQCEAAPCETVCPVNATVHTDDGLNAMTYNRCIGTRYCANNCPYKARRFNYFDYNKRRIDKFYQGPLAAADGLGAGSLQLQKNPNVSVRMRGVIEKCTYCVQRIQAAKIDAKAAARDSKNVQVPTGTVTVACQDSCPTGAITFGNWMDPKDPVSKLKGDPAKAAKHNSQEGEDARNYNLLAYIGTRPRTSYLAKIKNPNKAMPDADFVGNATANMH